MQPHNTYIIKIKPDQIPNESFIWYLGYLQTISKLTYILLQKYQANCVEKENGSMIKLHDRSTLLT